MNTFQKKQNKFIFFIIIFSFFFTSQASAEKVKLNKESDVKKYEKFINKIISSYEKEKVLKNFPKDMTRREALLVQYYFRDNIFAKMDDNEKIGYKVALTNIEIQEKFNLTEPVRGTIYKSNVRVGSGYFTDRLGIRPVIEGDLLVRIGSDKINSATTIEEAIEYIDQIIPYIEIADLFYKDGIKLTDKALIAVNAGANIGFMDSILRKVDGTDWLNKLKNFTVLIYNEKGEEILSGGGENILNHPLESLMWLVKDLKKDNIALKKGDLISLGSFTKFAEIKKGMRIHARYFGLTETGYIPITVSFVEPPDIKLKP